MQQHTIQIFMWAWYPESAKIHQKVSGGFWRIQDMSNIYTGGFWWIQDTSILCLKKFVDFGGFRILSSKNTQGVRVNIQILFQPNTITPPNLKIVSLIRWCDDLYIYLYTSSCSADQWQLYNPVVHPTHHGLINHYRVGQPHRSHGLLVNGQRPSGHQDRVDDVTAQDVKIPGQDLVHVGDMNENLGKQFRQLRS